MLSIPRLHSAAKSGIVQGKKCLTVVLGVNMTGKRGCCDVIITNGEKSVAMVGRTMEFSSIADGHPKVQVFQRGQENKTFNATGENKSKYGYMAIMEHAENDNVYVPLPALDGMNEMGLTCDALYFPNECKYPYRDMNSTEPSFWYGNMVSLVLGNCATLKDVRELVDSHEIFGDPNPFIQDHLVEGVEVPDDFCNTILPMHFQVFDANGDGLVIESIVDPDDSSKTKLIVYDSCGVMTNSPSYDWHLKNRSQYANLSNEMHKPRNDMHKFHPESPAPWGNGSSWLGMPGDYTPGSRFIRVAAHKEYVEKNSAMLQTENDGVIAMSHILNSMDLTHGMIMEGKFFDYTQWVNMKDLKSMKMYFRRYEELDWRQFDLREALKKIEVGDNEILYSKETNIKILGEC